MRQVKIDEIFFPGPLVWSPTVGAGDLHNAARPTLAAERIAGSGVAHERVSLSVASGGRSRRHSLQGGALYQ